MINPQLSVAAMVLEHSECAAVFQRHRIDFCCRGQVSIADACAKLGLPTDVLLGELSQVIDERCTDAAEDVRTLSTAELVARIVERHHVYLRKTLPFVEGLASKVARVHGDREPRLHTLAGLVTELREVLLPHLDEEERGLFQHVLAKRPNQTLVQHELGTMREEHLAVGTLLERMRKVAGDYVAPDWSCNSYRTLLAELDRVEADVLVHVHLENHVLLPRFVGAVS
jgi:regulator of cell morphogenesis and NO signaling